MLGSYSLVYKEGEEIKQYLINKERIRLGRALDNDLILNDFSISRHHSEILYDGSSFTIYDLNSRNGTRVNQRLTSKAQLKDDDEILLGTFKLQFKKVVDERVIVSEKEDTLTKGTLIKSMDEVMKKLPALDTSEIHRKPLPEEYKAEEIKRYNEILSVLTKVAQSLITVQPLDEVLELVMNNVFEYLPVDRGFLMLYDETTNKLVPKIVKYKTPASQQAITISKTIVEKVAKEKVSILTLDAQQDPRFYGGDSIIIHNIHSAMCVPLCKKEKVIGVIFVDTPLKEKKLSSEDLELLTALANYAAIAIEQARLNENIQKEREIRNRLERYHSPSVVNQILNTEVGKNLFSISEREVSVMFADIVGFSTLSEKYEPQYIAVLLNDFFAEMSEIIFKNEGTLDKFIGDAIMAVFGAPYPQKDHAHRCVKTALEMIEQLKIFNKNRQSKEPIQIRIGINSGKVVAGDIGSPKRIEYTVLGNTVNIASRLESFVAKPSQIVISEETYKLIKDKFLTEDLGEFELKGLENKIKVYKVIGSISN